MKKMRWISGILSGMILTCLLNTTINAQYTSALGVRVGGTTGLTFKHTFKSNAAIEAIVGTFGNGFSMTGLLEKQQETPVEGLFFYFGGGVHLASYDGSTYENFGRDINTRQTDGIGVGVDGIFGLEYRLPNKMPIAFALDMKPFVEIGTGNYVDFAFDPAISIKFVLK